MKTSSRTLALRRGRSHRGSTGNPRIGRSRGSAVILRPFLRRFVDGPSCHAVARTSYQNRRSDLARGGFDLPQPGGGSCVTRADKIHAGIRMREVLSNPGEARRRAALLQEKVHARFTRGPVVARMMEVLG